MLKIAAIDEQLEAMSDLHAAGQISTHEYYQFYQLVRGDELCMSHGLMPRMMKDCTHPDCVVQWVLSE